ncbi:MAG: hypothetical protein N3E37_03120 [Candidatus Micrarchaeota archaeon]|nr:hypothetical protein [Candidatus Micrarchaeota archaeon]
MKDDLNSTKQTTEFIKLIKQTLISNKYYIIIFFCLVIVFYFVLKEFVHTLNYGEVKNALFENYILHQSRPEIELSPKTLHFFRILSKTKNNVTYVFGYYCNLSSIKEAGRTYALYNISIPVKTNSSINNVVFQLDNLVMNCIKKEDNYDCKSSLIDNVVYNKSIERYLKELYDNKLLIFLNTTTTTKPNIEYASLFPNISYTVMEIELNLQQMNDDQKKFYLYQVGVPMEEIMKSQLQKRIEYANLSIYLSNMTNRYWVANAYVREENNAITLYSSEFYTLDLWYASKLSKEDIIALANKITKTSIMNVKEIESSTT